MKKSVKIVLFCILIIAIIGSIVDQDKPSIVKSEDYEAEWRSATSEEILSIAQILGKEGIRGCGEFRVKEGINSQSEYLLACTANGLNWDIYLIFINSQNINLLDASIITPPNN